MECVQYAREQTGILIHGDAHTWWDQASDLGYSRGNNPELRAVLCFPKQTKPDLPNGHVAVVADINSPSEIVIDHANWPEGTIRTGIIVTDVSGNWTRVTVGNGGIEFTISGFIYDEFVQRCIIQTPYDWSVCDGNDVDTYLECRDTNLCDRNGLGGCQLIESGGTGTSDPPTESIDIHITHVKIRFYKSGTFQNKKEVDLGAGESCSIEMEVKIRNKSSHDLEDVDVDYLVVKDKKDFDPPKRYRLEDEDADVEEGEKEEKHSGKIKVSISKDLKTITVSGEHSFTFPIANQNLREGEITLYFYTDVETKKKEDRDVSSESASDEYGKLEINIPKFNTISILKTGTGTGSVSDTSGLIDCGGKCIDLINENQTITLKAIADQGSFFAGWLGTACGGNNEECSVAMNKSQNITAIFNDKIDPGDINNDGKIDFQDSVIMKKILSGKNPDEKIYLEADVNKDGKLGVEELMFIDKTSLSIQNIQGNSDNEKKKKFSPAVFLLLNSN